MGGIGTERPSPLRDSRWGAGLLWASLVPLLLLLHPYGGLVQDARIYIGRGVADRDPAAFAGDLLFGADGQTGFSLLRPVIDGLLGPMSPPEVAMLLALTGSLLWLAGAIVLARRIAAEVAEGRAAERLAWAMVVAALAMSGRYGGLSVFAYAETIATPRVFAEAAGLAALAALLAGRRPAGGAFLVLAFAIHPLMALPITVLAIVLTARDDRRWLGALAAALVGLLLAAALNLPLAGRLFTVMDPAWWSILRGRSTNLFPTLWSTEDFGRAARQGATLVVVGWFAPPRVRALLWGAAGVGAGGLALSFAFGDLVPDLLVTQLQPWRALWLVAVLGNASLVLAAVTLWRRGAAGRLILAALAGAWSCDGASGLAILLSAVSVALGAAARRGSLGHVAPRVAWSAAVAAALLALVAVVSDAEALHVLLASSAAQGGEVRRSMVVAMGVQRLPLLAVAVLVALAPGWRAAPRLGRLAFPGMALAFVAGAVLWDDRPSERRGFESPQATEALQNAFGPAPGAVLWVDEAAETWFLLARPAFLNSAQAAPMLFSRDLALEWAARGALLRDIGLARPYDLAPWTAPRDLSVEIALTPAALERFCADPRRPAGLVAPGDQRMAVPPGLRATLWRPPFSIAQFTPDDGGIRWRTVDSFTAVGCGPAGSGPARPAAETSPHGPDRPRDAGSLG